MKTIYWGFWLLLAVGTAAAQGNPTTVTLPPGLEMDPGSITYPGALIFLGAMLTKWKPTFRVEIVDKRES